MTRAHGQAANDPFFSAHLTFSKQPHATHPVIPVQVKLIAAADAKAVKARQDAVAGVRWVGTLRRWFDDNRSRCFDKLRQADGMGSGVLSTTVGQQNQKYSSPSHQEHLEPHTVLVVAFRTVLASCIFFSHSQLSSCHHVLICDHLCCGSTHSIVSGHAHHSVHSVAVTTTTTPRLLPSALKRPTFLYQMRICSLL